MTKVFSLRISTIHTLAKQQVLRDRQFAHTVHVDSCLLNEKWAFLPLLLLRLKLSVAEDNAQVNLPVRMQVVSL